MGDKKENEDDIIPGVPDPGKIISKAATQNPLDSYKTMGDMITLRSQGNSLSDAIFGSNPDKLARDMFSSPQAQSKDPYYDNYQTPSKEDPNAERQRGIRERDEGVLRDQETARKTKSVEDADLEATMSGAEDRAARAKRGRSKLFGDRLSPSGSF